MVIETKIENPLFEVDRVKILFSNNLPTLILAVFSSFVFYFVFQGTIPTGNLVLIVFPYAFFSILRHIAIVKFWKKVESKETMSYISWEKKFAFLTFLSGLSFGVMNYICFSSEDIVFQTFCIAMSLGYASGSIDSFSASVKTVASYTTPTLWCLIFALVIKGGESVHYVLAGMSVLFYLHGLKATVSINKMIKRELAHRITAIQSSKMSALGEMANGMAHEINNPLTVIYGNLNVLERLLLKNEFKKEIFDKKIKMINENVRRVSEIISDLRTYSRNISDESMSVISVGDILDLVTKDLEEKIQTAGASLNLSIDEVRNIQVQCRVLELKQAITNLIQNAVEAVELNEEKNILISGKMKKGAIVLFIENAGGPIQPEIVSKMIYINKKGLA